MLIEAMRPGDIEAIAQLRFEAFFQGSDRTLEEDAAGLRGFVANGSPETALVARIDDVPVGSVLLVQHELEPAHDLSPWLAGLVVAGGHRRKGVGTALVRALERRAAAQDVGTLYLYTWEARAFYAALGWKPVETFEQDGETTMLMSRGLHNLPAT